MVPIYPCSMEKELGDYERSVTLKRKNGILAPQEGHTVGIAGSTFYFLDECDVPSGVNYGYDRPLNLFRCQRVDYDRQLETQFSLKMAEMQKQHEKEIKELKAKQKAELAKKAPLTGTLLKWMVQTIKKVIKHNKIIIKCIDREIECSCREPHGGRPVKQASTRDKRRNSEIKLQFFLNALESKLPQLEKKLEIK